MGEAMSTRSMTEMLGLFDPNAEVLGCLITVERTPNHHTVLATFATADDCAKGFDDWKGAGK